MRPPVQEIPVWLFASSPVHPGFFHGLGACMREKCHVLTCAPCWRGVKHLFDAWRAFGTVLANFPRHSNRRTLCQPPCTLLHTEAPIQGISSCFAPLITLMDSSVTLVPASFPSLDVSRPKPCTHITGAHCISRKVCSQNNSFNRFIHLIFLIVFREK